MLRSRQEPEPTWNTWGSGFTPTLVSMSPDMISTSPFGSVVAVGYQRPAFMSGSAVQRSATGS